jgi:hypothetical protein
MNSFFLDNDSLISRMDCYQHWGFEMLFINLCKFRKKPTKEMTTAVAKLRKLWPIKEGVKFIGFYWTLGR